MTQSRRPQRKSRRRKTSKKTDPAKFWGDHDAVPKLGEKISPSTDPAAVVRSLGAIPLVGQHNQPELLFSVLYERSVGLATALAASADLVEGPEEA